MTFIAQNIDKTMRLTFAMHKPCAQINTIAQINANFVHLIKSMHSACAFKTPNAQKLDAFAPLRERELKLSVFAPLRETELKLSAFAFSRETKILCN